MKRMRRSIAVVLATAAVALAGCGGGAAAPAQTLPVPAGDQGPKVAITAENIAFAESEIGVAASTPFTLVLDNRDAVPHNVSIYGGQSGQDRRFEGAVFSGPSTRWYAVPALAPGEYRFVCDVHPNMTGRLVVK